MPKTVFESLGCTGDQRRHVPPMFTPADVAEAMHLWDFAIDEAMPVEVDATATFGDAWFTDELRMALAELAVRRRRHLQSDLLPGEH